MPTQVSYPGVYIEEIPSGVRTITGVSTSITAFIGSAARGPVDDPETLHSFADYERTFGGLYRKSTMSYAVQDFFLNGGSEAIVVRVASDDATAAVFDGGAAATAADAAAQQATADATTAQAAATNAQTAADAAATAEETAAQAASDADADAAAAAADAQAAQANADANPGDQAAADAAADAQATADQKAADAAAAHAAHDAAAADAEQKAQDAETANADATAADAAADEANAAAGALDANDTFLTLVAASPGEWANSLTIDLTHPTVDPPDPDVFNLAVYDAGAPVEKFLNLVVDPASPRSVARVLENQSDYVRIPLDAQGDPDVPATRPAETTGPGRVGATTLGSDGADISGDELTGSAGDKTGLYALENADLFNLLCIPPPTPGGAAFTQEYLVTLGEALSYCVRRRAMLIVDSDPDWGREEAADAGSTLGLTGVAARNAAVYFPWIKKADPLLDFQIADFAPSGAVAGIMARTDASRGVWKAPAGIDAAIAGVAGLRVSLTDGENGDLNPLGVNVLRSFPVYGRVVWGARTMRGADQAADEYKYVPVRRTALFIEESLYRGTQWVVFEPNDEPLWSQIRLNVGAFMHGLFRQGAFQGKTPAEAYLVKCDKTTTTQNDINLGIVNILVGFAPLKPAEFVIIKIQQLAGQVEA